jgi:hypothetical protein
MTLPAQRPPTTRVCVSVRLHSHTTVNPTRPRPARNKTGCMELILPRATSSPRSRVSAGPAAEGVAGPAEVRALFIRKLEIKCDFWQGARFAPHSRHLQPELLFITASHTRAHAIYRADGRPPLTHAPTPAHTPQAPSPTRRGNVARRPN